MTITLESVQDELKTLSEQLAVLNQTQNDVLTKIDELTSQIDTLKNKSEKKQIQQQTKDKMLIHQKLIVLQRKKLNLQNKLEREGNQARKLSFENSQQSQPPAPQFQNSDKGGYQPPALQLTQKKSSTNYQQQLDQKQILERIRKNFATEDP